MTKLYNYYSSIAFEAKHKAIHGKGRPGMSSLAAKVSDCLHIKTLLLKQGLNLHK